MTDSTPQPKQVPILAETPDIISARTKWQYNGQTRPNFALAPASDQESVWDYPRPPLIAPCPQPLSVYAGELRIAATTRGVRVLETAGAPTYYFPPEDVASTHLTFGELTSVCEWKGVAQSVSTHDQADVGWRYVQMFSAFSELFEWVSFYPSKLKCYVGEERVEPQPGGYYGGWVTNAIVGPIKGEPGSQGW